MRGSDHLFVSSKALYCAFVCLLFFLEVDPFVYAQDKRRIGSTPVYFPQQAIRRALLTENKGVDAHAHAGLLETAFLNGGIAWGTEKKQTPAVSVRASQPVLFSALAASQQNWAKIENLLSNQLLHRPSFSYIMCLLFGTRQDSVALALWRAVFAIALGGVLMTHLWGRKYSPPSLHHAQQSPPPDADVQLAKQAGAFSLVNQEAGDYDFWGSHDSLDSRVDLARTYLYMNQFDLAKEILNEVITIGNDTQVAHANALLSKLDVAARQSHPLL